MIDYIVRNPGNPQRLIDVPTAWREVVPCIEDILDRFEVKRRWCLEFGVDYGYSTAVLANHFHKVVGVDTFAGDAHAGFRENLYAQTSGALAQFTNVKLIRSDYRDFIDILNLFAPDVFFDCAHVDIFHEFEPTYQCGMWAVAHSDVTIFHDTRSFPEVMRACEQIAQDANVNFYEWNVQHGVGILSRKEPK